MSYFPQYNFNGGTYDYVITPEMADITAVQSIYGAAVTRGGDTTYGFHSNAGSIYDLTQYSGIGTPAFTIYDSGGNDTLDVSGYSQNQTIDLTPGGFSSVGGYVHNVGIFNVAWRATRHERRRAAIAPDDPWRCARPETIRRQGPE